MSNREEKTLRFEKRTRERSPERKLALQASLERFRNPSIPHPSAFTTKAGSQYGSSLGTAPAETRALTATTGSKRPSESSQNGEHKLPRRHSRAPTARAPRRHAQAPTVTSAPPSAGRVFAQPRRFNGSMSQLNLRENPDADEMTFGNGANTSRNPGHGDEDDDEEDDDEEDDDEEDDDEEEGKEEDSEEEDHGEEEGDDEDGYWAGVTQSQLAHR
jgi:hypothetical protein